MMKIFLLTLFLLLNFPSLAASEPTIDPSFCRALIKHLPDKSVEYRPGIDVHGKPVAPADLPDSNNFQLQQPITIPLTTELFKILNLNASNFPFNTMKRTKINLGTLTINGNRVFYNGQPLTSDQQDKLAALCLRLKGIKP